jgi:anti-sigma-K factor RskA
MAEIIDFAEIQEARRKARARIPERENLERAVQLMRENLAAVAAELVDAPREEQVELLTRIERLAAMIRYGMRMLGEPGDVRLDGPFSIRSR